MIRYVGFHDSGSCGVAVGVGCCAEVGVMAKPILAECDGYASDGCEMTVPLALVEYRDCRYGLGVEWFCRHCAAEFDLDTMELAAERLNRG